MRKFGKILTLTSLSLIALAACGDNGKTSASTYRVTFYSESKIHATVDVKAGRRITEKIEDPTPSDPTMRFNGWYKEESMTNPWVFETDIVTEDRSLYAGWRIVTGSPSEIKELEEGFSSGLTWTQSGLSADADVSVTLYAFVSSATDEEGNLTDTYETEGTVVPGSFTATEETVRWVPDTVPQGGKYKVGVSVNASSEVFQEGIYFKGDGSQSNPYLVVSSKDFASLSEANGTVGEGKLYNQIADIAYESDYGSGMNSKFAGTYDGKNHTIEVNGNCGLLHEISEKGTVKNLTVSGNVTTAKWPGIGALANFNSGKIENVTSRAMVESSVVEIVAQPEQKELGGAGGIVGINRKGGTIVRSTFSGSASDNGVIKATNGGGGIAGTNYGTISECVNKGCLGAYNAKETGNSLSNYSYNGGIAGYNYGRIEKSGTKSVGKLLAQRAKSADTAKDQNNIAIGGVAGYNDAAGTIEECYYEGIRCHGDQAVGGIAGINAGTIASSYASGKYYSSTKIRSYIGGRLEIGGIAGRCEATSSIENCYNTANVFAYGEQAYGIAKNADSSVYIRMNHDSNTANSAESSLTPVSNTLLAPAGNGNVAIENVAIDPASENAESNYLLAETYLSVLGDKFAFSEAEKTVRLGFELEQSSEVYTIHFYAAGSLYLSKTVENDSESVLRIPNYVQTGKELVGWSLEENGEILFEKNQEWTYETLTSIMNGQKSLNVYAVMRDAETTESNLVIGYLTALKIDLELAENLKTGFETYCETEGLHIDSILLREYSAKAVKDYTAAILNDGDVDIVLGAGSAIQTSSDSALKDHVQQSVAMNIATNPNRYAVSLTLGGNTENAAAFLTFIQTPEAAQILNPEVRTDALVVGIFARYCPTEYIDGLKSAFETYLTEKGLNIQVTFITLSSTSVGDVVDEIQTSETPIDVVLGGGGNIGSTKGTNSKTALDIASTTSVTINGSNRNAALINQCANSLNAVTFIEFLSTDAAQAVLNPSAAA